MAYPVSPFKISVRGTSINNPNIGTASYTYDVNCNKLSETWTGTMAPWSVSTDNTGTYPQGYDAEDRVRNFKQTIKNVDLSLTRSDIGNISKSR